MKKYTILDLYTDTNIFNVIAGTYQDASRESFDNQAKLIEEEYLEFRTAQQELNLVETLDGLCDSLITIFGYIRKIEETYDIDFSSVMERVAANNLSKYPSVEQVAIDTVEMYKQQGIATYYEKSEDQPVFVIRDAHTNKVKKPKGFISVSLADLIPVRH